MILKHAFFFWSSGAAGPSKTISSTGVVVVSQNEAGLSHIDALTPKPKKDHSEAFARSNLVTPPRELVLFAGNVLRSQI
jgi:hypothetical protein